MDKQTRPGENEAVASVVLGIVSCVLVVPLFLTAQRYNPILYTAIPAGLSGFFGIVLSHISTKKGNCGNLRLAGLILSWVGAIFLCGFLRRSFGLPKKTLSLLLMGNKKERLAPFFFVVI